MSTCLITENMPQVVMDRYKEIPITIKMTNNSLLCIMTLRLMYNLQLPFHPQYPDWQQQRPTTGQIYQNDGWNHLKLKEKQASVVCCIYYETEPQDLNKTQSC